MNNSKVVIITGPIQSGKTTFLKKFFELRYDSGGFLTPDQLGKRVLYRLDDKSIHDFEIENDLNVPKQNIGKYFFKKETFNLGNELISNVANSNFSYFVIDEIGKLELKNQGFDISLDKLFWDNIYFRNTKLILVIRDYLLNQVINKYKIQFPVIIDIQDQFCRRNFVDACEF